MQEQNQYLNTKQAANRLNLSKQFLEAARVKGGGPTYIKVGRAVRYSLTDLDAWMVANRRCHTGEGAA